jgi:hypothetical protein
MSQHQIAQQQMQMQQAQQQAQAQAQAPTPDQLYPSYPNAAQLGTGVPFPEPPVVVPVPAYHEEQPSGISGSFTGATDMLPVSSWGMMRSGVE